MGNLKVSHLILVGFMITAGFQDLRHKSICVRCLMVYGSLIFGVSLLLGSFRTACLPERAMSMGIGFFLLLLSRASRGSIGEGDGWFLVITGMYFGFWSNLALLLYGLLFCSIYSLGLVAWGFALRINVRKKTLPFLPFLIPVGIWMVLL